MKNTTVKFYATYDADNMYFAWEVPLEESVYVSHDKDNGNRSMHAEASMVIRIGDDFVITDGSAEAPKIGIARLKSNGNTIATMFQTAGTFPNADITDLEYATRYENGTLVYEMKIPADIFHMSENDKLNSGEKIAFSWMATVGGDPDSTGNQWLKQRMICFGSGIGDSTSTKNMVLLELSGTPVGGNGTDGGSKGDSGDTGTTGTTGSTGTTSGNKNDDKKSDTTAATDAATSDSVTDSETEAEKSGCGSSVAIGGIALVAAMAAGAACIDRKRK